MLDERREGAQSISTTCALNELSEGVRAHFPVLEYTINVRGVQPYFPKLDVLDES